MSDSGKLNVAWLYDDSLDTNDGVAQYVKTLGAWLSRQGHQVSYLCGDSKLDTWEGGRVYSLAKNIHVRWAGNRLRMPIWPKRRQIKSILQQNNFDVVHVTLPYSPVMAKQVINRLPVAAALVGTWHIYPANGLAMAGSKLLKLIYGRSLRRFDAFVSVSPAAQHYAKTVFKVDSAILPNVVKFPQVQKRKSDHPTIVFLGRLVERKGIEYLIRAFQLVHQEIPSARLIIAGSGPLEAKLRRLVSDLDVGSVVSFSGYIEEAKKYELLGSADIACFPALYGESFGVVLIEAMAAGADTVLGGDNPGYRSVLGERPELLVDPRQTVAFAKRLGQLLKDKPLVDEIARWQKEEIKKYDVETVGPQLVEFYKQAIAKRHAPRHN